MADYTNPETVTDENGKYLVSNNDPTRGYVVNDGTYNRVLIGYDKDGFGTGNDFGMKVSKSGYDVFDAPDSNIIMSSAYNMFKILVKLQFSLTVAGAALYVQTVTHTYGSTNLFISYISTPWGGTFDLPAGNMAVGTSINFAWFTTMSTEYNQFNVQMGIGSAYTTSFDGVYGFTVYVLEETV